MDMDKTEKNQEKFTCGEFEYQVIRSARKTMTLEVRRDGNVIVRAPLRTGLPRIKRFVNQKQEWFWDVWNGQKNTGNRSR